jgi:hypothetical protein
MTEHPEGERAVIVYTAGTAAEAMVVRGLLESAGIPLPGVTADPFPLNEAGWSDGASHGVEIYVYEPQADEARRIIEDYVKRDESSDES